jgi:glycerol uptake facilitator-like aquaporin
VQWSAAVLAAAALVFLPALILFGRPPDARTPGEKLVVYGGGLLALALLAAHAVVSHERGTLLRTVIAGTLNAPALVGVFLLILVGGSCSDEGHVPAFAWGGAIAVYLAGAAWGLRARWHSVWLVPASVLAGGLWLVAWAVVLTGSTGACLE